MVSLGGFSSTIISLMLIIAAIWIIIEAQRLKHKLIAIALIALILFSYFSFAAVFNDSGIDFKTGKGIVKATKIYFSWLVSVFFNLKTLTANAINLKWEPDNRTINRNT